MTTKKEQRRLKIKFRIRKSVKGTAERPRLSVFRSNKQIYAQVINDITGTTLASASSLGLEKMNKTEQAKKVGELIAEKAKAAGIDFAIIRCGYRGYGSGKLVEDEYAQKNLAGATEAGLPIGAYFFSQALSMDEADQEIEYMLGILGDYRLDMPIILDWEIPASDARTANMDARTLTDIQLYFCEKMKGLGYQPMVYFNWHQSENLYYLSELEDFPFWLALYQDRMRYPWKVEMWQYTCTGKVPGINGDVDINVYMP